MSELSGRDGAERVKREARELLLDDIVGRRQWKGSKLGYVTGFSFITGIMSGAAGMVGKAAGRVTSLYGAMTRSEDTSALPVIDEAETDAARRFALAVEAHGKSEADLAQIASNTHRGFFLYAVLLLAVVVIGIASLRYGNITGLPRFMDVGLRFATVPALAALMIRFGYLNWIVRNRRLDGLGSYLTSGGLFPVKALGKGVLSAVIVSMVAGWVALAPSPAFAASDNCIRGTPGAGGATTTAMDLIAKPHCDDVFYNLMKYVVPGVGPIDDEHLTNAHKAVADGFTAFSGILMFVGSLMLGWHVLAGIVQSAYSGKVLGERWHQIWAPARVVLGLGSLAPVAGGYGAAQVMVVYLMLWGGNLANSIWTPYVTALANGIAPVTSTATTRASEAEKAREKAVQRLAGTESIVKEIVQREVCNAYVIAKMKASKNAGSHNGEADTRAPSNPRLKPEGTPFLSEAANWAYAMWDSYNSFGDKPRGNPVRLTTTTYKLNYGDLCGSVTLEVDSVATGGTSTDRASLQVLSGAEFDNARLKALEKLVAPDGAIRTGAKTLAATYVQGNASGVARGFMGTDAARDFANNYAAMVKQAGEQYAADMLAAAKKQLQELDLDKAGESQVKALLTEATTKGWAVSGTYYVTLSQVQGAAYSKAMVRPSFKERTAKPDDAVDEIWKGLVGTKDNPGGLEAEFKNWWENNVRTSFKEISLISVNAGRSERAPDSWLNSILDSITTSLALDGALGLMKDLDPVNPMKSMIDFGHFILMCYWATLAALVALGLLSITPVGAAINAVGSSPLWGIVVTFVQLLVMAVFAVGVIHAYVIPMIPYVQVLFFLMGMMVLLVEALIAAPLWAFFHVRMDGQDLVDQVQRPGYMIAFNLLLRPSLMILGLMMSLFVFGAMSWFVSNTFVVAARAAGSGHSVGIIGMVVMVSLLCFLHYHLALRSFGLINQVPDRVTRWFGQGGENLGEERDNEKMAAFAVGRLGSKAESLLQASAAGAGNHDGQHNPKPGSKPLGSPTFKKK